ncbi:hypothetical protein DPMN_009619 [Dreissena polymorpha]|uniref:Uncharacterized protein n=1 Tax=Dreissena polymorpha TaxID=45954 RepID=A0A9D4N1J8_DREPO|nr:hypothetical protein DPMN_009619 [Dreissena polymorpha]
MYRLLPAFDHIWRTGLWNKILKLGKQGKIFLVIQNWNSNFEPTVSLNCLLSLSPPLLSLSLSLSLSPLSHYLSYISLYLSLVSLSLYLSLSLSLSLFHL